MGLFGRPCHLRATASRGGRRALWGESDGLLLLMSPKPRQISSATAGIDQPQAADVGRHSPTLEKRQVGARKRGLAVPSAFPRHREDQLEVDAVAERELPSVELAGGSRPFYNRMHRKPL